MKRSIENNAVWFRVFTLQFFHECADFLFFVFDVRHHGIIWHSWSVIACWLGLGTSVPVGNSIFFVVASLDCWWSDRNEHLSLCFRACPRHIKTRKIIGHFLLLFVLGLLPAIAPLLTRWGHIHEPRFGTRVTDGLGLRKTTVFWSTTSLSFYIPTWPFGPLKGQRHVRTSCLCTKEA